MPIFPKSRIPKHKTDVAGTTIEFLSSATAAATCLAGGLPSELPAKYITLECNRQFPSLFTFPQNGSLELW